MSAQHAAATEEAVKATRDACDDVVRKMEAKCEDAVAKAAVEAAWVTAKAATPTDDESQMKVAKAQQMAVRAMAKHAAMHGKALQRTEKIYADREALLKATQTKQLFEFYARCISS